jgi:uncharacterized circularly permuted ATP-grasp superfamily protein
MQLGPANYPADRFYDELLDNSGNARAHAQRLVDYFNGMQPGELAGRQELREPLWPGFYWIF